VADSKPGAITRQAVFHHKWRPRKRACVDTATPADGKVRACAHRMSGPTGQRVDMRSKAGADSSDP